MDDKKAYEAYRVQQFSGPHPALHVATAAATPAVAAHPTAVASHPQNLSPLVPAPLQRAPADPHRTSSLSADPLGVQLAPDQHRVIVHFDVDAFYSQVEEVRNPRLRGSPLAVTQKYLVVTCNYPARHAGVTKLMNITEARKKCPGLVMVPGEDLTPYRAASRDIRAVLSRWGPCEKLGLDEMWVDITQEVTARVATSPLSSVPPLDCWPCPLATADIQITADSRHRPQDIRAAAAAAADGGVAAAAGDAASSSAARATQPGAISAATLTAACTAAAAAQVDADFSSSITWRTRLYHGCVIASEMKAAVLRETQYSCSAGVAFNKLLSKLVSGLHKPNGQTAITPDAAAAFIAPLPARALPGVGFKTEAALKPWGVVTVNDIRGLSQQQLVEILGDKTGSWLFEACRGVDCSPVVASGPPKTISVEDSFKSCSSWEGVKKVLQVLVPDLLDRVHEDMCEFGFHRKPSTLSVKWRKAGTGWHRSSASTPWPLNRNNMHSSNHNTAAAAAAADDVHPLQTAQSASPCMAGNSTYNSSGSQPAGVLPCALLSPDSVEIVAAAALRVLKQQLPGTFCLTLLNIGVTGFKEVTAGASIQQYFKTAAAAAVARSGGISSRSLPNSPHPPAAAAAAGVGLDSLQLSRTSTAARRDYDSYSRHQQQQQQQPPPAVALESQAAAAATGLGGPVVLTKRQERLMLELGQQQQQQGEQQQQHRVPALKSERWQQQQQSSAHAHAAAAAVDQPDVNEAPPNKRARIQSLHLQQQQQQSTTYQSPHQQSTNPATDQQPTGSQQLQQQSSHSDTAVVSQYSSRLGTDSFPAPAAAGNAHINIHQLGGWGLVSCELVEEYEGEDELHSEDTGPLSDEDHCEMVFSTAGTWCQPGYTYSGALQSGEQQQQCDVEQQQQQCGSVVTSELGDDQLNSNKDLESHEVIVPPDLSDEAHHEHRRYIRDDDDDDHTCIQSGGRRQQQQQQQSIAAQQQQQQQQYSRSPGPGATAPLLTTTSSSSNTSVPDPHRVVIHVDCDCYYCQVEVLDRPDLRGCPIAVTQFNGGGFVAVSYEARAAGVRCGDGVGAAGRAAIQHLRDMGALSMEEAKRRCPGLVVLPMRPARYREVADQLHKLLRSLAPQGQVEKASYDDYYMDVTALCGTEQQQQQQQEVTLAHLASTASMGLDRIHVVTMEQQQQQQQQQQEQDAPESLAEQQQQQQQQQLPSNWHQLEPQLQQGLLVALNLKAAVYKTLGLSVSCGVASGKLLARLVGPLHKPNSITALPAKHALAWIRTRDLRTIPQLQKQTGAAVVRGLGSSSVGALQGLGLHDLQQRFGVVTGSLLFHVYAAGSGGGGGGSPVRERGLVKQLVVGRSCQPLNSISSVRGALTPLVAELWQRVDRDAAHHQRLPVRLRLTWRIGYSKQHTKTANISQKLRKHMEQMTMIGPGSAAAAATAAVGGEGLAVGDVSVQGLTRDRVYGGTISSNAGVGTAVCKMLEDAFIDILTIALRGAECGSSSSGSVVKEVKGQTRLVVGRSSDGSRVSEGSTAATGGVGVSLDGLNITRLSLAVAYQQK